MRVGRKVAKALQQGEREVRSGNFKGKTLANQTGEFAGMAERA